MTDRTDMSTAEQIAARLSNDGLTWETPDGVSMPDLCDDAGGTTRHHPGDPRQWRVFFPDGSALCGGDGGWDIEGDDPYQMAGG